MRAPVLMLLVCAFAASCSLQMTLPPGFLRLKAREAGDLKAVTADDARIWVREFAVENDSNLDFWAQAVTADLKDARGYQLAPDGDGHDGAGNLGKRFVGEVTTGGETCGYFVAVFFLPRGWLGNDKVRVVEFTAKKALFDRQLDAVRNAVATLQ